MSKVAEATALAMYEEVPYWCREELEFALEWAKTTLTLRTDSSPGPWVFQLHHHKDGVVCSFSKNSWAGEHTSRPMELGSEAIVMAVCEYLNGL